MGIGFTAFPHRSQITLPAEPGHIGEGELPTMTLNETA
jgi:hypothetical protein